VQRPYECYCAFWKYAASTSARFAAQFQSSETPSSVGFQRLLATRTLGRFSRASARVHGKVAAAVRNLLRWCRAGQNVDSRIALLSKYLGHVNVTGTYWYLTAVPELMALTSGRFERWAALPDKE
jgi:hypothetical protein